MANWYVSSAAGGGGNGQSEGTAWTLAEAVTNINNSTVGNGDTVWAKSDGTYTLGAGIAIAVDGASNSWKHFKGYTTTIGDNGKATIQTSFGGDWMLNWYGRLYWTIENFIIDGNNVIGGQGLCGANSYRTLFQNLEVKNWKGISVMRGVMFNCYIHDNLGTSYESYYLNAIGCVYENNARVASEGGSWYGCIFKDNDYGVSKDDSSVVARCIFDHNKYEDLKGATIDAIDCIFVNNEGTAAGGVSILNSTGLHYRIINCAFYNNTANATDITSLINCTTAVNPAFTDPANYDYTTSAFQSLGFSHVGMFSQNAYAIEYNGIIGLDQTSVSSGGGSGWYPGE